MRTDVKIGIVLSVFVVGVAAYYFALPGEQDIHIPGAGELAQGPTQSDEGSPQAEARGGGEQRAPEEGNKTIPAVSEAPNEPAGSMSPVPAGSNEDRIVKRRNKAVGPEVPTETITPTMTPDSASPPARTAPQPKSAAPAGDGALAKAPGPSGEGSEGTVNISLPTVNPPDSEMAGETADPQPLPARTDRPTQDVAAVKTTVEAKPSASVERGSASAEASAADVTTNAPAAPAKMHVVKEGETFASIAVLYYGSEKYTRFLMSRNPQIADPRLLRVGQEVGVPALEPTQQAAAGSKPGQAGKGRYRVKKDDTFYAIASRALGDPARWPEIYELNRDIVGDSPADLRAGQVLQLPEEAKPDR